MRSAAAGVVVASLWTIACSPSGPVGPVVHEHHAIERGAATSARVEINMSAEIGGYQSDDSTRDPWGPVAPRSDAPRAGSAEPPSRKND